VRAASTAPGPELALSPARRRPAVSGPARVDLDGATLWVAEGWTARADRGGTWRVTR
jgi:hypothetical protein